MERFEDLLETYSPMIHHVMKTLRIYKNREEFLQIGRIALWEADQNFDQAKGKFSSYAYTCIRGRMLDALKKSARREQRYVYPKECFWEGTADEQGEKALELETLLAYARGLTDRETTWLLLTFYKGMTMAEIAAQQNVSLSAVKKWKKQAVGKIRKRLLPLRQVDPNN
ncbi:sigma-70 family RNA polymerase sigma factor [Bacillus xiapuensis]|uniref:sigma-70 family RNA polymerase sigma factor n=1 Tax=Bacillus xiapuensis TaxID=2014075 RepID=UPI000C249369|nr:sigma-70 family RNA polymerase sigma factor [Bacillus xiapuensis]